MRGRFSLFPICLMGTLLCAQAADGPRLKIEKAVYRLDPGALEFSFEFVNSGDSAVYVDCQGRPKASARGATLALAFGGNTEDTSVPARVGPRQTFRAARKLYGKAPGRENPSIDLDPAAFAHLKVEMAVYPERAEGEGEAYLRERATMLAAPTVSLVKQGKRQPPPPLRIIRTPGDAPPPGD